MKRQEKLIAFLSLLILFRLLTLYGSICKQVCLCSVLEGKLYFISWSVSQSIPFSASGVHQGIPHSMSHMLYMLISSKKWYRQLNSNCLYQELALIISAICLGNTSAELFLYQPSLEAGFPPPVELENLLELFCQVLLDTNSGALPLIVRDKLKTLFKCQENNMLSVHCSLGWVFLVCGWLVLFWFGGFFVFFFKKICSRYRLNVLFYY